jgi:hypothetical protein
MVKINLHKTHDDRFNDFLNRNFKEYCLNKNYLSIDQIGIIREGKLFLDSNKIREINPISRIESNDIEYQINNLYLEYIIEESYINDELDLDYNIILYNLNKISIINSSLKQLSLGFNLNNKSYNIPIEIIDSIITFLKINQDVKSTKGHVIVDFTIKNSEFELIEISGRHQDNYIYKNLKTKILHIKSDPLIFENCEFNLPIIENPDTKQIHFKQSKLIFIYDIIKRTTESIQNNNYNFKILDVLPTLKYLSTKSDSENFVIDLERTYAYFDSLNNPLKRLIFSYNEYYYNIKYPFISLVVSLFLFQLVIQDSNLNINNQGMAFAFLPTELIKEIIFKDFFLSIDYTNISFFKILLSLLSAVIYYSLFCFLFALKKNFGYRKIR